MISWELKLKDVFWTSYAHSIRSCVQGVDFAFSLTFFYSVHKWEFPGQMKSSILGSMFYSYEGNKNIFDPFQANVSFLNMETWENFSIPPENARKRPKETLAWNG